MSKRTGQTLAELLQTGIEHHQEYRLPEAVAIYAQILEADPDQADALHLLGLAAHQFGRNEEALKLITCATTRRPDVAVFHNSRGVALATLGRPGEAIDEFRLALHLDADCLDARTNLQRLTEAVACELAK
jgi:Flp pilus assembly protein TadD